MAVTPGSARTLGILVGGGPAPGINGVINAATIAARNLGWRVLGIPAGYSRLMKGDTSGVLVLDDKAVARLANRGGSILLTSRANPTKNPDDLKRVVHTLTELGVTDLVTIGGDDTASSALRIAREAAGRIRVAHVPKTIDNDLPLPGNAPTFGFETAMQLGARLVQNLAVDSKATGRWYLVTIMGRTAGHLAVGTGTGGSAAVTIIPEEFPPGRIRLDTLADLVEGAVVKRLAQGKTHGVAVLAEGLVERLDPADLERLGPLERDDHGHPRLSEISLGKIVKDILAKRFAARGLKLTPMVEKVIGYELRCEDPLAFDVAYCRALGVAAVEFLAAGRTDALISVVDNQVRPLPFEELRDPATGRVRPRLVDVKGSAWRVCLSLQSRLRAEDLAGDRLASIAAASKEDPETLRKRFEPIAIKGQETSP